MKRPHNTPKVAHKAHKRQKVEKKTPRAEIPIPKRKIRLDDLGWTQVSMPDRLEDFEGFYGLEEIEDVSVVKDAVTGNLTFETSKTDEQIEQDIKQASQRDEDEAKRLEEITFGAQQKEDGDEEEEEGEGVEKMETPQKSAQVNVDDAWEGFSDDEAAPNGIVATDEATPAKNETAVASAAEPVDTTKQEKPKSKKEKAAEKAEKAKAAKKAKKAVEVAKGEEEEKLDDGDASEGEILGPSAFSILADRADDEDDEVDVSAWEELKLSEKMLDSLAKLKFHTPTTIQESCIPEIMAGRDLIGKASTGSGKTLAFGIPIIEAYLTALSVAKDPKDKAPIALIIAPTRELAHQITAHITALCAKGDYVAPKIASVTGGLAVQKQRRQLETADIVVGTPGRLWEVISSGQGLLDRVKQIRFLVVDEADRLLSHGNYKELGEILKILEIDNPVEQDDDAEAPTSFERQTLVFSATFQKSLQQKLAGKAKGGGDELLNKQQSMEYLLKKLKFREEKPKFIDANPNSQMASKLKEGLVECAGTEKDLYLYSLLMFHPKKRALIFTNSISAVRRLTPFLQNLALPALPLHSSMVQKARLRSIERFKERPGSILVATDVAARGLDIPQVDLVIHYHLPRAADTYVHRSGRTARADLSGSSILICGPEEVAGVRRLIAKVHSRAGDAPKTKKAAYFIRTLDIDRRIVNRLKPRATISKQLADTVIAKEKKHTDDNVMRQAAEDLGVDYDSSEFEKEAKGKRGRGTGRKKKEKENAEMTKGEQQALRAELKGLLSQRINTGVSARYLTSGGIDVEALMAGEGNLEFLGNVDGLGFDDDE
jgi:ATP-dependent RNA helicase DDX24/MAK5